MRRGVIKRRIGTTRPPSNSLSERADAFAELVGLVD
jgi:hypothetical protein